MPTIPVTQTQFQVVKLRTKNISKHNQLLTKWRWALDLPAACDETNKGLAASTNAKQEHMVLTLVHSHVQAVGIWIQIISIKRMYDMI